MRYRAFILCCLSAFCLLSACAERKQALETWVHADTGSYGAALSPDGRFLLTGEIGGFARVWDLERNQVRYSLQHEEGDAGGIIAGAFPRAATCSSPSNRVRLRAGRSPAAD